MPQKSFEQYLSVTSSLTVLAASRAVNCRTMKQYLTASDSLGEYRDGPDQGLRTESLDPSQLQPDSALLMTHIIVRFRPGRP